MLAQNIRKFRLKKGLTQEKLSRLADISTATLVKIEANVAKEPTIITITKIADVLEVSIDMLVGRLKRKG